MRLVVLLLALVASCSSRGEWEHPLSHDSGPSTDAAADGNTDSDDRLCDGSKDVRLLYWVGGGSADATYTFENPHGWSFLAIDGTCRFYADGGRDRTIGSGTLTADEEQRLCTDLGWNKLEAWSDGDWTERGGCFDAPATVLGRFGAMESCTCGCGKGAPSGLNDALLRAGEWTDELESRGEPQASVSAVAVRISTARDGPFVVDWPLERRVRSIENFVRGGEKLRDGPYASFANEAEVRELRALRDVRAKSMGLFGVREGMTVYDVVVRDELPTEVAESMSRLRDSWRHP
jgi:hypothetical protein